jgi:hypothetical protein
MAKISRLGPPGIVRKLKTGWDGIPIPIAQARGQKRRASDPSETPNPKKPSHRRTLRSMGLRGREPPGTINTFRMPYIG